MLEVFVHAQVLHAEGGLAADVRGPADLAVLLRVNEDLRAGLLRGAGTLLGARLGVGLLVELPVFAAVLLVVVGPVDLHELVELLGEQALLLALALELAELELDEVQFVEGG